MYMRVCTTIVVVLLLPDNETLDGLVLRDGFACRGAPGGKRTR